MFVAADVHYLPSGGAWAAAVVAADRAFSRLTGDRIAVVPDVAPYQPGQFYLRDLPPLRAVLGGLPGLSLLVVDGYADLNPNEPARPGRSGPRGVRRPGDRRGQERLPRPPPMPSRSCAGPQPGRCTSPPPGCPAPTPPTSSGTWPVGTGCPTPCAGPTPWPATACPSRRDTEPTAPNTALTAADQCVVGAAATAQTRAVSVELMHSISQCFGGWVSCAQRISRDVVVIRALIVDVLRGSQWAGRPTGEASVRGD